MFVYLERGITNLAIDQEARMTELKSQPVNELELIEQDASDDQVEPQTRQGSDYVKRAIEDFKAAIELSKLPENFETDKFGWIKPRIWLARAKLKNNQVQEAIIDFTDAQNDDN